MQGFQDIDACAGGVFQLRRVPRLRPVRDHLPPGGHQPRGPGDGAFEMRADADKCIGCGFCADGCPCGIWNLVPNDPL